MILPTWQRRLNLLYMIYFIIHIPIMLSNSSTTCLSFYRASRGDHAQHILSLYKSFTYILVIDLVIDLTTLYPSHLVPTISKSLIKHLVTTYQDQFFVKPPHFFVFFMWLEAWFHIPVCTIGIVMLWRRKYFHSFYWSSLWQDCFFAMARGDDLVESRAKDSQRDIIGLSFRLHRRVCFMCLPRST